MPNIAIEIRDLNFSYRSKQVLFDLNIDIPRGITALVGVNGAGKTTLIRNILGDLTGFGQSRFFDVDGAPLSAGTRRRLGYLPQSFGFPPNLTVAEFVTYFAWLRGIRRRDREQKVVQDALEQVNLMDQYWSKMGMLSGGMLRRAGIAQALVHSPNLILLDEPTAGLDPQQRLDLRETLASLAENTPILISTHLLEDVANWDARMIILDGGRVRFVGSPKELLAETGEESNLERAFIAVTKKPTEAESMIWTFMRRTPSRYVIPAVLLSFAVYGFFSRDMEWRNELIRAISAAGLPLVVTGPVLSGVAGYETWQWRRRLQALASGLPTPQAIASAPWWGVAGVALIMQSIAIAAHTVTAIASGAVVGTWTIWPIVIQLAGICGYTALGALIGWYIPSPVAAPVVSLALITANVPGPAGGIPVRALTDVGFEGMDFIGIAFNPTFMAIQFACFLGLTVAAALPRTMPTSARNVTQVTAAVMATVAAAGMLIAKPQKVVADTSMAVRCTTDREITVCSPAIWADELRLQLIGALAEGVKALRQLGITETPKRFDVETPATVLGLGSGMLSIDRNGVANGQARSAAAIALTSAAFCFDVHDPNARQPTLGELNAKTVLGNILGRMIDAGLQGGPDPVLAALDAMPMAQRQAWIQTAYRQVWACDPSVDIPNEAKRSAAR